ncbi:nucleolar pre-ribosomal-associated protein 1 isoform 2-T2 [Synchiropus picturatus]
MGKNRPSEDSEESNTPVKKPNVEFNGTVFKSMLKDPTTAMKGLSTFISTAKKLPSPDLYDVVEGYIKISMECAEIFKLLDPEKKLEREMMLVFESLEMILLRTASDLSHFSMVGSAIVKKTLSGYMKLLQGSFHSHNHRFVHKCLSFLTAMVSQGPDAAREVLSNIHIDRALAGLANKKEKNVRAEVRMSFIQFVLSFLVSGDSATIGQILTFKEFLPEILSTGLREDRMTSVNLILSTLKSRVVLNKAVTKTQKVRFFTPAVLANIVSLYKWNGIVDAVTGDDNDSESAGVSVVRELTHSFLLDLCCSRKHGLSFYDASLGTAGRPGNIVLLQFLVGLKQATEDDLVAELVVKTLKSCPDLLSRYFKETQYSYSPRPKTAWQDNLKLLKKIYEAQPEVSTVFHSGEVAPPSRLLSMIMVLSFPPVCDKTFFTQGLNLNNTGVQLTTLSTLNFILKRADKNVEYLLSKSESANSASCSRDAVMELAQQYREMLSKVLPDTTIIVALWQSLSKQENADSGRKTKSQESDKEHDSTASSSAVAADSAEIILLKTLVLQVLCLYHRVVPHLIAQSKFDFSKLLKGVMAEKASVEEVPPVLQFHMLQLALELPASKFSWFRLQESADTNSTSGEKSVLYLLLKMFVSNSRRHLRSSTRMLVVKVLKDRGVFEYTWTELELWLDQLSRVDPNQQEEVIKFLERVLVKLACNLHTYTDKVASLVQDAAYLQANLGTQDGEAASIPVSHIDDVLDMLDVIMEGTEGETEEFGPTLSEDLILQTFPFSVAVPAALEARNTLAQDKGAVFAYVSAVLSDVLHSQRDPLPLCLCLLQYDKELLSPAGSSSPHPSVLQLHQYYTKWLPAQSQEDLVGAPSNDLSCGADSTSHQNTASFGALMRAAYCEGLSCLLEESFKKNSEDAVTSLALADFPLVMKQVTLYIRSTVENFSSFAKDTGAMVLKTLVELLQELVVKLQGFEETTQAEADQETSELFVETSTGDADKEQVLVAALSSVLKHPCLQQWYLALELASLPSSSLNPVRAKRLCAQLSDSVTALLKTCAPSLTDHLDLLSPYLGAVENAVLQELWTVKSPQALRKPSRPFQALLALHRYMDPSKLRDVVSRLLLLPQQSLVCVDSEAGQLSVYGQAALQILTQTETSRDDDLFLSQAHLHGLGTLLLTCSSPSLEDFLLQTLTSEPGSARLIHPDVLLHCLQRPLRGAVTITSVLLQNCSTHRLVFESWCLDSSNLDKLREQMDSFLPVVSAYLQVAAVDDPARPIEVQAEVLKALKRVLLPQMTQIVLGDLKEESGSQVAEILSSLIKLSANITDFADLVQKLPEALQKVDSFERWKLEDVITEMLPDQEKESWRKRVAAAAIKCLTASYSHTKDQSVAAVTDEHNVLGRLQKHLTSAGDVGAAEWNSFVKNGLKYRFRDAHFLETLRNLLAVVYGDAEVLKDLFPPSTLHMMISSHSLFLPAMLEEESSLVRAKEMLVSLLLWLVKKCPSVCNVNHFVVLLGAYGATLSITDQTILQILREYEKNDVSLLKFQSILWGPAALEHHKTRKSLGASLWKQTSADDLLALLNTDKMLKTIAHFPQQRRILPQDDKETIYRRTDDLSCIYDPCFLLPLFSNILSPESVIDCRKFVSTHALSVTFMALSSYDHKVRAAAYHVLTCFYQHLEGARFREKAQLLYFMEAVKNGVWQQNQSLSFVVTTYISKVAQQMLRPEDHMYVVLNRLLLSYQGLDFRRVPEFFKLFFGFDLEHKVEREWILSVLEEGVKDGQCYDLCNRQRIFQSLLAFSSSPLCDEPSQSHIFRVLCQLARVNKAAYDLIKSGGLLAWIMQLLAKRSPGQQLLGSIVDLTHALWFTVLGKKETQVDADEKVKCLRLPVINEFLCLLLALSRHLRLGLKTALLSSFLQTLSSVLKHRETAFSVNKQSNWLTLRPRTLSCPEALTLLHCWASLTHSSPLLAQTQALFDKHKLTEFLGMEKKKVRGKGSSHKKEEEDSETEKQEELQLMECRFSLSSVFQHWEPAFTELSSPPRVEIDQTSVDTAHLLTKWSLRCLVEAPYDEKRARTFLNWAQKFVIKHKAIADRLMQDSALKADLLRLHHQAFEFGCYSSCSARRETCQLFTKMMTHLLESRDQLPRIHRAIVSACLPAITRDQAECDAAVSLLALYIHEVWSGAESAELFLSHIKLVTSIKCPKVKKSATENSLRSICKKILTTKS